MRELAIEARALTKRFGKVVALDSLDLQVQPGESMVVLGDAAAGKSVALRLLAGVARPSSGSVLVRGVSPTSRAGLAARCSVGVLWQEPAFYGWMTGREALAFAADLLGVERKSAATRVAETLDRVGLAETADRPITGFPPEMRRRLDIAQALVGGPDVLLLDEPLAWLDRPGHDDALAMLESLRGSTTMVVATRDVALAEAIGDRVTVLDAGRTLAVSDTRHLLDRLAPRDYLLELVPGAGLALAGLTARLGHEAWVMDVTGRDGTLRVAVRDEARADHELLPAVVATGVPVLGLSRDRPGIGVLVERLRGETR